MKKMFNLLGIVGLSILFSFGLFVSPISASSVPGSSSVLTEEASQLVIYSKYVEKTVIYTGKIIPPNSYYYNSLGYKGNIPLDYYFYDAGNNKTSVVYSGTVYCESNCAQSASTSE